MNCQQQTVDLDISLEPEDILRVMGGANKGKVRPAIMQMITRYLDEFSERIRPRGTYVICDVTGRSAERMHLAGCPPFEGQIARFMEAAERIAVFVVTIGDEMESMAERRMEQGATLEGFTLDAIGSAAADASADALADHLVFNDIGPDEAVTPPFSPGYCGMPLEQQRILFSIVDAASISVELTPTLIMRPIKSVSGLIGIGRQDRITASGIPCESCQQLTCRMRR